MTTTTVNPKLSAEGLSVGYGPVNVVSDIDLALPSGSITAVLGPNGAGKSTTCKSLAGLIPAQRGRILLDGIDITAKAGWWRARHGIFLAPEGRGIFPGLTVDDNLRLLLPRASERALVYERFERLGERRRQQAGSLSGGEQQMLSLAPTLVHVADVVIADEPTLGLAPRVAEQVLQIFVDLRERGTTVLLVAESPQGIVDIADHAALLHVGKIAWSGAARNLSEATIEESYFGTASHD
jgi:ABC-type branched-subunit amino acid transport system ATPase component